MMRTVNWWMVSVVLQSLALIGVVVVWIEGRKYEERLWKRINSTRAMCFQTLSRVSRIGVVQAELVRKIEAAEAAEAAAGGPDDESA